MNSVDPQVRANARCEVHTIDRVELVNEGVQSWTVDLERPVPLYESDRIDSERLWALHSAAHGWPPYGEGVTVQDLNRMTKLCVTVDGDYNDNGRPDISEHAGLEPGPDLLPEHRVFNRFAYFIELYWGRYEPAEPGRLHGRYVVREKTRLAEGSRFPQFRVPISYHAADGSHWRDCRVARDSSWQGAPATGLDFAEFDPHPLFSGMNHHSQFKCVRINNDESTRVDGELGVVELFDGYRASRCHASAPSVVPGAGGPTIACSLATQTEVADGDVLWAAALFTDHRRLGTDDETTYAWNRGTAPYVRGCVNDCVDAIASCPGVERFDGAISCVYDETNFGRFLACEAQEICDGDDNDFDDEIDEGNPGGGGACDTGELGRCERGTRTCIDGKLECLRDWDPQPEMCNNLDDDCNGLRDDEIGAGPNPRPCTVKDHTGADRLGICALGHLLCEGGTYSRCYPTKWDDGTYWDTPVSTPLVEIGCNGMDDDCNGLVDECPAVANAPGEHCEAYELTFGNCGPGWEHYVPDADGDGYAAAGMAGTAVARCACAAPADFIGKTEARPGLDCCDACPADSTEANAGDIHPGQTKYSSTPTCCVSHMGGGQWDRNCDNRQERLYNTYASGECPQGLVALLTGCGDTQPGWVGDDDVTCGEIRLYRTGDCQWARHDYGFGIEVGYCSPVTVIRIQECR
jgi:hypothetical protein